MCENGFEDLDKLFKEGQTYICKPDGWFIDNSECYLAEHVGQGMGIFEGKVLIEQHMIKIKSRWYDCDVGEIVDDRELCMFEEFDLEATRVKNIDKIIGDGTKLDK